MAVKSYVATLTATSTNLRELLFPKGSQGDKDDCSFSFLRLEADKANTADAFVGEAGKTISSTEYGSRLDPTDTAAHRVAEFHRNGAGLLRLSDFAAVGTAGEKIAIIGVVA